MNRSTPPLRPRLLDLFCGAGGASVGYARAGFEVVGVDIRPQPRYPYRFIRADALTFPLNGFDVVHASPPCQRYSALTKRHNPAAHPDLLGPMRARLLAANVTYIIENVEGAPLIHPVRLCGSSFALDLRRHRLFESSMHLHGKPCDHAWQTPRFPVVGKRRAGTVSCIVPVYGHTNYAGEDELRKRAMGISWMTMEELSESIPPAYTEFLGRQALPLVL